MVRSRQIGYMSPAFSLVRYSLRSVAVLISLLAVLVMAVSAGVRALSDTSVVLEGPSTLELGLIGGGILIVYAVVTRAMGRRRAQIASSMESELAVTAPPQQITVETAAGQGPSRGAA
jgi:hypothetical protein